MTKEQGTPRRRTRTEGERPKAVLVRETRKHLGLSQAGLGRLIGTHKGTICRWEQGSLEPDPWHLALLRALSHLPAPPSNVPQLLREGGPIFTLASLLGAWLANILPAPPPRATPAARPIPRVPAGQRPATPPTPGPAAPVPLPAPPPAATPSEDPLKRFGLLEIE